MFSVIKLTILLVKYTYLQLNFRVESGGLPTVLAMYMSQTVQLLKWSFPNFRTDFQKYACFFGILRFRLIPSICTHFLKKTKKHFCLSP